MGFHLKKIEDGPLGQYIGSRTIYAVAESDAFDSPVTKELEQFVSENSNIVVCVSKEGVPHCLETLKKGGISGRDVQLLITEIETNYQDGFIIIQ